MVRYQAFSRACVAVSLLVAPALLARETGTDAASSAAETPSASTGAESVQGEAENEEGRSEAPTASTVGSEARSGSESDGEPPESSPADAGAKNPADMQRAPTANRQAWDMAQISLQPADANIRLAARAELGTLLVAAHKIQFGESGTAFDYVRDGGQENLFPFARFSAEVNLFDHHNLVFLYQPLTLETDVALRNNLDVYDTRFDAGTPMQLKYGFDFARVSYFYDFWAGPRQELGIGASLQIRNATINFVDVAGTRLVSNRNVGPVPILKARWRSTFDNDVFVGAEIDGFYASIPIANGDLESQVEGAICDASFRVGAPVAGFANAFLNLRYLGGGSSGFERGDDIEGDGFTDNWLHTVAISLGAEIQ